MANRLVPAGSDISAGTYPLEQVCLVDDVETLGYHAGRS
jgi:hypothetical protein